MLIQMESKMMVSDPCFHGKNMMIDFGGDEPHISIKQNKTKSLEWHLKKAKAFLRSKKIKGEITNSYFTRYILPPNFSGMQDIILFDFELEDVIPNNPDSVNGTPIEYCIHENYCFYVKWDRTSLEDLMKQKNDNIVVNWYLKALITQTITKKEFTRVKRAILKQLGVRVGSKLPKKQYWIKRP